MNWDAYARFNPLTPNHYAVEPIQNIRVDLTARRCVGSVLDVGSGDGYSAAKIRDHGHSVLPVDISELRVQRMADDYDIRGQVMNAEALDCDDQSFDTVVLGEILEHQENPGKALAEAFRVARERVVVSLPLNGWEDPTHQWRISLDTLYDPNESNPTKTQQIVLTFQRGECWPPGYSESDMKWRDQFASQEGFIEEGDLGEHPPGSESWTPTEAGSRDRV